MSADLEPWLAWRIRMSDQLELALELSVVIPAYNERKRGVGQTVTAVPPQALRRCGFRSRIIVVDDGSARRHGPKGGGFAAQVVRNNRAIEATVRVKAGIEAPAAPLMAIVDADGAYRRTPCLGCLRGSVKPTWWSAAAPRTAKTSAIERTVREMVPGRL